jgi:hypothetical protein
MPFKRANDYAAYMLQNGKWGSDLEALATAEIYQVPVLIWSTRSKAHGFLLNHGVHTTNKGAIHLLHSGNHYDALIPDCRLSNCRQTNSLANSISSRGNNERPRHPDPGLPNPQTITTEKAETQR